MPDKVEEIRRKYDKIERKVFDKSKSKKEGKGGQIMSRK